MVIKFFGVEAKKIESLENVYVSKCGRAFGFRRWGSPFEFSYMKDKDGYMRIGASKDGKAIRLPVHRLVAEAYIEKSSLAVNHIDFCRSNNAVENLEYVTNKENTHHSLKAGRIFQGNQVMDDEKLLALYTVKGNWTYTATAKAMGLSLSTVSNCSSGKTFKQFHEKYYLSENVSKWL